MSFKDELKSYINLTAESIQETRSTSFDSKIYDDISKKIYDYIHSRLWICVERKDIKSKKVGLLGLNRTHFYEYTLEYIDTNWVINNTIYRGEEYGPYKMSRMW